MTYLRSRKGPPNRNNIRVFKCNYCGMEHSFNVPNGQLEDYLNNTKEVERANEKQDRKTKKY